MSDFVKRSLILSEELAAEIDSVAIAQDKSFTAVVREAVTFWLANSKSEISKETETLVRFTREEQKVMDKICLLLSVDSAGVLKQCWNEQLPKLIETASKRKEQLEALAKKL